MNNASEQLMSEIIFLLSEEFSISNNEKARNRISSILQNYSVNRIENENSNSDLQEKINLFLSSKKLEGLSNITLDDYKLNLRIFADKVKKENG